MTKYLFSILMLFHTASLIYSQQWPVLKEYDQQHIGKIALPVGGIGTGTVSLAGNGELMDWEIMNKPGKGFSGINKANSGNGAPMFAIYIKEENKPAVTKGLMGPVNPDYYEGSEGSSANNHGVPRFRSATFSAAYPFAQVHLSDETIPVEVTVKAFNPLIPCDADASGIPVAVLRYVVKNKTTKSITVSVCGLMNNFIGCDGSQREMEGFRGEYRPYGCKKNQNIFRSANGLSGIFMHSDSVDRNSDAWGTIAISAKTDQGKISHNTCMNDIGWSTGFLNFWDDLSNDGMMVDSKTIKGDSPQAALAVSNTINAGETKSFEFYITWHFPNRIPWEWNNKKAIGNYYTTKYTDAWDVIEKTLPQLRSLEDRSIAFVSAFCKSSLPDVIKEAAMFNLANMRSQTCFRTPDGNFYGWEGYFNHHGSCFGSCTHVWNYETSTAFLFGDIAKRMRKVEFGSATDEKGFMSFRVCLPVEDAHYFRTAAADGQMGCIMKAYREWQLSGDDELLKSLWPNIKKALSFAWIDKGWDENKDGVMDGCQHNTMDVEYYGPNPQMQFWYLGALRAATEMADFMQDKSFSKTCSSLFEKGKAWTDKNLFNGEYYKQIIMPRDTDRIAPGLMAHMGSSDYSNPDFQLGNGCLVDQLAGQYMADICGLGFLASKQNIEKTLLSIYKYNRVPSFIDHFNNMRSFALGNEAGLVMASFPHDRPLRPFPYFAEVMTGFEYTAASSMIYAGMNEQALTCIRDVRNRFDGTKRNPFNETECGFHYARAMAAWSTALAYTGFQYSAVKKTFHFNGKDGSWFWSNGYAFGTIEINSLENSKKVTISVIEGSLAIHEVIINGHIPFQIPLPSIIKAGSNYAFMIK